MKYLTDEEFNQFQSKYWKPEPGSQHTLVLTNWDIVPKTFGDSDHPKLALVFEILSIDGKEYVPPKEWCTTSGSLVEEFRPIIKAAQDKKVDAIKVLLKRSADKNKGYSLFDMSYLPR